MEKYTTGTRPLRRRSGCKEEGNPYMRRVRTRLQTRHFVASSIRKEGRVAPFLESRRNKQYRPIRVIPLPPSATVATRRRRHSFFYDFDGLSSRISSFDDGKSAPACKG